MKVSKKILRIVLIVCIVIGVFLLGSFIKSQHTDKVKQDIRESIEEQEKREQEEKKKQEEQALEEKRKQEEQKRLEEEQKRLEEEKKKEEERQKLENQKLSVLKKMGGKWEVSYCYNSETNESKEYITNDERGLFGIIADAGIDWLKSKDGFLSKLAGYGGEALLSGNEPIYIQVDIDSIDLSSLGYGKYYFDEAVYIESPDVYAHSFEWLDEKGAGIGIAYYEEYKDISLCEFENGQVVDNLHLFFCR